MTVELAGRRIELWVESRDGAPAVNPIMQTLIDRLHVDGVTTTVRAPDREMIDVDELGWRPSTVPDLILLKSATSVALAMAVAAEASGVQCLNHAFPTLRAHDKAATVARLHAAGLPVPATTLVQPTSPGRPPDPDGRWVSKPVRGIHGRGVQFHESFPLRIDVDTAVNDSCVADDGTFIVQRRIGAEEPDVKVYVADRCCFVATKSFHATSFQSDQLQRRVLDAASTELVLAVGDTLDLPCFGIDLRSDDNDELVIIDANPFPGYRGCPDAVSALRREVERALEGRAP